MAQAAKLMQLAMCTITEEYFVKVLEGAGAPAVVKKKCLKHYEDAGKHFPYQWAHATIRERVAKVLDSR